MEPITAVFSAGPKPNRPGMQEVWFILRGILVRTLTASVDSPWPTAIADRPIKRGDLL